MGADAKGGGLGERWLQVDEGETSDDEIKSNDMAVICS